MTHRLHKKRTNPQQPSLQFASQMQVHGSKQIQRMIHPKIHLWLERPCQCLVCKEQKPLINQQEQSIKEYKELSRKSHEWLKKILLGLTQKINKGLKLYLPDILFVVGDGLEIFSTNKKDYRIMKFAGTTPVKAIFHTVTRLRKEYKGMLEENFRKTMIDKINPKFMHVKYFDRLLPSHFHDGDDSKTLSSNKSKFKSYILNNNQKYIISAIEEHKMNDKEPFVTIRYSQGNFQLLNQKEFEMFSIVKLPEDIVYFQSFIKSKQAEAIVTSIYSENNPQQVTDVYLWKKSQLYVMVLLGGLGKYDEGYDELQNFEDQADQLMKANPSSYAKLMTYQIVHFLSMASHIYIRHIKIKWIINDIDNVYLQEIIEFQTEQVSKRPIRYKMPPTSQMHNFYQDADFFVQIHREMRKKKEENLIKVKKQLQEQTYEKIIEKTTKRLVKRYSIEQNHDNNPQTIEQLASRGHMFKGLTPRKKPTRPQLNDSSFMHEQKMSIETKDSTMIKSSNKFSTITVRRSSPHNQSNQHKSARNSLDLSRKSINAFGGDIITRYQLKLMESERKRVNKSVNRYERRGEKPNRERILDFQIRRGDNSGKLQARATIDFV